MPEISGGWWFLLGFVGGGVIVPLLLHRMATEPHDIIRRAE